MQDRRPADYAQRMLALDPGRSFLCEAPAGSGKTELLSQRFLTLLGTVSRPEELLAITFTRKSTAAMRDRIIGALLTAKHEPEPENEYQRITWRAARAALAADTGFGWDLLSNPNRLQIRTFDSLCTQLNGALPLHSTFGAPPEVTDEPDELYRRAVRHLFQDLETDARWADALASVLSHLDGNFQSLENLLSRMLQRRQEWLPTVNHGAPVADIRQRLERHLQHVCDDVINRLKQLIPASLQQPLLELAEYAAANLHRLEMDSPILACRELDVASGALPDSDETGIRQWFGLLELLTTRQGQWRTAIDKRIGFPQADRKEEKQRFRERKQQMQELIAELQGQDALLGALHDLRYLPAVHYDGQQLEVLQALTQVLPVLAAHLTLVFSDQNCVDFPEVNIRARTALGGLESPTDLAMALDYRIRHILVDEFQDVSSSQVVLLRQLTAGWQDGDGHTLFCVGDAMQSIYGFRDANVGLFIHCEEHGLGNIALEYIRLNTNFRSHAGLVDWINAVFAPVFPKQHDIPSGAVRYSASVAFDRYKPDNCVAVLGINGDDGDDLEAREIRQIINNTRRDKPAASIAILVRTRRHAGHIAALLKKSGISYRAVDLESLSEHPVIRDLLSLSRALLHPADRIAWLSVLRAPWCGLTLADLLLVANDKHDSSDNDKTIIDRLRDCQDNDDAGSGRPLLTQDGRARLARVVPVLARALEVHQRKPLRQWLEGTWLELGGPSCLDEPADLDNAEKFFSLVESLDDGGGLPELDSLDKAAAGLFAAPDPSGDERLQIMTIHKAKGLEFDVVIIPSLHRSPRKTPSELILWQERLTAGGEREVLMAPIPARGGDRDRIYRYLQEEQRKKEAFETCRLLYVACTRARQDLYLLAHVIQDEKTSQLRSPAKSSLLHTIWDSVQTELQLVAAPDETATAEAGISAVKYLRRLPADWQLPPLPQRNLLKDYTEPPVDPGESGEDMGSPFIPETNEAAWQDPAARHVGTVVHQIFQEIGRQGLAFWEHNQTHRGRSYRQARLAALGVPPAHMRRTLAEVDDVMQAAMQDAKFNWLFAHEHPLRYCEYPVTIVTGQGSRNLVIDLLLQERSGNTWVIDYKTGRPAAGETRDEYIGNRVEHYRNTMQLYARAVSELGYSNVRAALYFPLLARWVEYGEDVRSEE